MARCPFAAWRPLPENDTAPRITPTQIIDHSIVGSAEGAEKLFRTRSNLESHFIVDLDGTVIQLMDTERQADANFHANRRPDGTGAISIETADNGDPDNFPWTPRQMESLKRLHDWLAKTHGIPRRQCPSPSESGLGFHTLFGAPSEWTPVAKSCPGTARKKQWFGVLLPAFKNPRPEEETMTPDDRKFMDEMEERIVTRLARYTWDTALRIALVLQSQRPNTFFNADNAPDLFAEDVSLKSVKQNVPQ